MKSYSDLYEFCISETNRKVAIKSAKHSKRIRQMIKERNLTDYDLLELSYDWIVHYKNAEHAPITIYDGITRKRRTIIVPTLEELVVQHCIVNALKPMFRKGMYEHSYASIPGRGAHKGKEVIQKWIKKDRKNTKYVLKMDIYHFFDTVQHSILKEMLAKYIRDDEMLRLLFEIIDVVDVGLPLGFYTSQWLSNWFLQKLDHVIKEQFGAVYYVRYMDDMVVFGRNKKNLHEMRKAIEHFLADTLGLHLKSNWQVFLFDWNGRGRDLDFMGFRFFRNRVILRKSIMLKATRKAKRISKKEKATIYDTRQMLSYLGWLDHTDTYQMYLERIKPYVSIRRLKRYISVFDQCCNPVNVYHSLAKLYT